MEVNNHNKTIQSRKNNKNDNDVDNNDIIITMMVIICATINFRLNKLLREYGRQKVDDLEKGRRAKSDQKGSRTYREVFQEFSKTQVFVIIVQETSETLVH